MKKERMKEKDNVRTDITGRMLPHNMEAEQSLLCCMMIDDNAAIHALDELTPDSFYSENHAIIFGAMARVRAGRARIDLITLTDELEKDNKLLQAGGLSYLSTLSNFVPNPHNYRSYTEIVKNKYTLRQLAASGSKIIEQAFNNDDSAEVLNAAEMWLYGIAKEQERGKLVPVNSVLGSVVKRLRDLEDPTFRLGIPTGFAALNFLTNGLQPSDLVLIAARPSVGKTAFGMNLITNIATNMEKGKKYRCAVFSLEMTKEQLTQRMLCSVAGVSMSRANKGTLTTEEWKRILAARSKMDNADIYIDDTSLIKPMQIMEKCIRLKNEKGLDVVLIDYLQLLSSDTRADSRTENRQTQVAEITRYLKIMAKELNVPVLLISQLSRKVEERQDKMPMLSDLRESGAIEQDADIVMFIHRPLKDTETSLEEEKMQLIIAKHRNGELGRVPLIWEGASVRFKDDPDDKRVGYEKSMMSSYHEKHSARFRDNIYSENAYDNDDDNSYVETRNQEKNEPAGVTSQPMEKQEFEPPMRENYEAPPITEENIVPPPMREDYNAPPAIEETEETAQATRRKKGKGDAGGTGVEAGSGNNEIKIDDMF